MKKFKLNWKKKTTDDRSGRWYSAKIPTIKWEYIIDIYTMPREFTASIFFDRHADDVTLIKNKAYKKLKKAKRACEKHFNNMISKINKLSCH